MDIQKMKAEKDVEGLVKLLLEGEFEMGTNSDMRGEAIWALAEIDTKEAVESLGRFLEKCVDYERQEEGVVIYPNEQRAVCVALATVKGQQPQIGDILIKALIHDQTCTEAARAIRDIGQGRDWGSRAVEPLIKVLKEAYFPGQRLEAARALGWLGDKRAVGSLKEALHDDNEDVRYAVAEALKMIQGKKD
jgi:HEAT repeat protein